ncbi:hypothetical protein [Acrocarpospora catenulata]|uniref:hypothetical protein n=1 Tax=Acrocarpospora catenulata TaxID=2836182 RepID=UPI001BD955A2|nr:hypothetical protein [Acrocarpospora catenulata]
MKSGGEGTAVLPRPDAHGPVLLRSRTAIRLLTGLGIVLAGWTLAQVSGLTALPAEPWYLTAVTVLLSVGLYGSAAGIPRSAVQDLRLIVLAVTVGVLLKAVLIALLVVPVFDEPGAPLLALAVAQIDPLSVAALLGDSRMSRRAKDLMLAWASFDDPITALLTVYFGAAFLGGQALPEVHKYLGNLGWNAALVAAVFLIWLAGRRIAGRLRDPGAPGWRRAGLAASTVLLLAAMAVAVANFLMLAMAVIGLFLRPFADREVVVNRTVTGALIAATFATGMVLADGVDLARGLVLGLGAFLAQAVVGGLLLPRGFAREDRVQIALGQQNGITALVLALALVPLVGDAVAVVAPAILVVNLLHAVSNGLYRRRLIRQAGS